MSDPCFPKRDPVVTDALTGGYLLIHPEGLDKAISFEEGLNGVTLDQLRAACDRYSARKTTVPGSYAYRHYIETGHAFRFGCCLGTGDAA